MMTTDPAPAPRVLLLAARYADAAAAMDLAVALAARMQARLDGVLAQDPQAGAGVLVTVGPRGTSAAAPGAEHLGRAYAADARAFRQRLDRVARAAALRWSFRADTGPLADLALALRGPGDLVILGQRPFLSLRGPVLTLEEEGRPAARLAADLARVLGLRLRHLPADTPPDRIDPLSASLIVLPDRPASDVRRLRVLVEAARCPVLLGAGE